MEYHWIEQDRLSRRSCENTASSI